MLSLTSPVKTPFHKIGAAPKLVALCLATVILFQVSSVVWLFCACLLVAGLYATGGMGFAKTGLLRLKPLWFFVLIIMVWHVFTDDMNGGIAICLRLLAVVGFANLVTMTTKLEALVDTATLAFTPLRRFGVNPAIIGFSVALVIRFIPVLIARAKNLTEAWRARSPKRANWRVVTPIFLTVLDDADHVAEALKARGGLTNTSERKQHGT